MATNFCPSSKVECFRGMFVFGTSAETALLCFMQVMLLQPSHTQITPSTCTPLRLCIGCYAAPVFSIDLHTTLSAEDDPECCLKQSTSPFASELRILHDAPLPLNSVSRHGPQTIAPRIAWMAWREIDHCQCSAPHGVLGPREGR